MMRAATWGVVLVVGLTGCVLVPGGGGGVGGGAGGGVAGPTTNLLVPDANPVKVTATPDAARAVTKVINRQGGTMSATGADGTTYTLSFPEGAVDGAYSITMTPLASLATEVEGPGFGVQLAPDGLQFYELVSLTVTPPASAGLTADNAFPLGWDSAGLATLAFSTPPTSGAGTLQLLHFSSYAYVLAQKGVNASLAALEHRLGGDFEARFNTQFAEASLRGDKSQEDALVAEYQARVVEPRRLAASDSCAAARLYLMTVLHLERMLQLLGVAEADASTKAGAASLPFGTLVEVCMKEEYELCRDEHIVTRILPTYLGFDRTAQLLGFGDATTGGPQSLALLTAQHYLSDCLHFDIDVDSTLDWTIGATAQDTERVHEHVHGRPVAQFTFAPDLVDLRGMPPEIQFLGAYVNGQPAPLTSSQYQVTFAQCTNVTALHPQDGSIAVGWLTFSYQSGGPADRAKVQDFSLALSGAMVTMSSYDAQFSSWNAGSMQCSPPTADTRLEGWGTSGGALTDAFAQTPDGPQAQGWTVSTSATLGTRDYTLHKGDPVGGVTDLTAHLQIIHTPQ